MKTNYQFSFNPNLKEIDNKQEPNLATFLKDMFPYLSLQSATFCFLIIHPLLFLLCIYNYTIIPGQNTNNKQKNIFAELASNLIYIVIMGRMGSQYQVKLGRKYYLSIIIVMQLARFMLIIIFGLKGYVLVINKPTLLSLYMLSLINIKRWKQNEMAYQQQQKTVQNYDLLDLNDTVIKLKTNQNTFMYESYTNKQFFHHNLNYKEQKAPKNIGKQGKKHKKSSKFMENINQQQQQNSLKLFKCVIYHFIVYSNYPLEEFVILVITQAIIYLVMASKILKKINFS